MSTMDVVYYHQARNFEVLKQPIPQIGDDDVLLQVLSCGVCGTDQHIHEGEFISKFPLTPGHEIVGKVTKFGKSVKGVSEGDRCVVNPVITCGDCFFCRRGQDLFCENFNTLGCTAAGGFAEYVTAHYTKLYKIHNLTDEEATLVEPAACAIHGADKLALPVGAEVLILGAGPTGLILSQILKMNGASKVVLAANKGIKTRIAQEINAADVYVEIDRENPQVQWDHIKKEYPYGFDAVVEATGAESVANDAINYVRRGGSLMVYGVYSEAALVHWKPSKIFGDEIRIIGSFAQSHCFPRAVAYLDGGKINVKGMVTNAFAIRDYQKALDMISSKGALKVIVKPSL